MQRKFERKSFSDFNYLTVDLPTWVVVLTYMLTVAATVGTLAWASTNEWDADV